MDVLRRRLAAVASRGPLTTVSTSLGGLVLALGAVVAYGWVAGRPRLLQLSPDTPAMQPTTAAGFLLCGAALLLLDRGGRRTAGALGALVAVLGVGNTARYLLGAPCGLDPFLRDLLGATVGDAACMAPNTAVAFALAGTGILDLAFRGRGRLPLQVLAALMAILAAVAGCAAVGYLFDVEAAHGWGEWTHMAPHTAAGLLLVAAALGLALARASAAAPRGPAHLLPLGILAGGIVLSILFYDAFERHLRDERAAMVVAGDPRLVLARGGPTPPSHRHAPEAALAFTLLDTVLLAAVVALLQGSRRRAAELEAEMAVRREAEARLREYAGELERSNKELDDFAYIASHDLREPLRGLASYARFLQEDYGDRLDDEGRRMLEALPRLTGRMDALVESLLQYSRVGRAQLERVEVALDVLVDRVADTLAPTLAERGVELHVRRPLPVVVCDPVLTEQVFANLVSNAAKYNDRPPGEAWVEVGARHNEGPPVLYVRDNGIGIPERHQQTIFRIFKRLHAQDRYGGGAGAGLTIVQKIVERHGGRIWLESEPGEGSTFFFTLGGPP